MFSSARTGCPAATWPTSGRPLGRTMLRTLSAAGRSVQQLDGPGLGRIAPQQADLLQVGQVGMDGGRRGQTHRLPDVANRGRIAVLRGVALDEVEDLLLALREVEIDH